MGEPKPRKFGRRRLDRSDLSSIRDILANEEHPLVQLERIAGITSAEAARRLGVSIRQYHRYKGGGKIPDTVKIMVDLGALRRPRSLTAFEKRLEQWTHR
jgi:hypothetical protein